jgi:amino acid adenylation domain-containing protein
MSEQKKNIESIYPLSPVQQGMLFHTLLAPKSGVYFNQVLYTLTGRLQKVALQRAWQRVVDRYEALRTLFVWQAREKPLQIVRRRVALPWQELDWRGLPADEQNAKLAAFLQADRQRGFDLTQPPLMRLALIRLGENHHELVWSHHHLLIDGWSSFLILKDVMAVYQATCDGRDCRLEPVRPYRDYINWLRRQDPSKVEGFWRTALKGFAAPTPLLGSPGAEKHEGHEAQDYELAEQRDSSPPSLTAALTSFARLNGLTLSTIVQGAWAILLSRYSRETDVVFGSTVSGRSAELVGIESMVGLFINSLPVRAQFSPQVTTLTWLKDFQDKLVEVRQYEHSPLVDVQGWSEVRRGYPLFQSLMAFENYPVDASAWGQDGTLLLSNMRVVGPTNYPLAVVVVPRKELSIRVSYDSRRFDGAAISRMLGHFNTLLEGIIANPAWCPAELPMLTEAERQQVLYEWNDTRADYPKELCVHHLFEQQVEWAPDAPAVSCEDRTLSYGELNARSNRLAHHLRGLGVGPDVLVAICMERSLEMVVGLLAILKAGGAYVPLDPSYPADRLAFMIKDSAPAVILSHGPARAALETAMAGLASRPPILDLEADLPLWTGQAIANPAPAELGLTSSHLAYVTYTSGSTGTPKGVMTEHRALINRLEWMQDAYSLTADDTVLQKTPFSFDVSVWEFFWPLGWGAKLAVAAPGAHLDPRRLAQIIHKQRVTTAHFVPSMLRSFLEHQVAERCGSLTRVICSGEALPLPVMKEFHEIFDKAELHNLYGPTEAAIDVTAWTSTGQLPAQAASPPIGRPISNTQIYLLDGLLEPVPVGVAGEIYIGGEGVARGYLNRPELTAERFIASPFVAGDRLYKTGDLGRYLADGNIEFLGRNDFQVKIRGYRIELGEIEARLSSYPGVREAVVLTREDETGDKRLVAYIVSVEPPGAAPLVEELRDFLRQKLPEYMVPSAFVTLQKLPLISNGKIDRNALPAPDEGAYATQAYEAPVGVAETAIAEIWAELLGLERVGRLDNFFDLGGHSLLAIRVLAEMNRSFDRKLPLTTVYNAPTVAALASLLNVANVVPQFSPLVSLKVGNTFPPLFMVCGGGGDAMELSTLAKYIPGDRQIYGLQARNFDGISHPHERVEDMAEYYMKHIRELQPNGPYLFAGYCFGGLVALEMAHRFLRNGEDVAMLTFLETAPPQRFLPPRFLLTYWKRRFYKHAAALAQLSLLKAGPHILKGLRGLQYTVRSRYFAGRQHPIGARYFARPQSALDSALPEAVRAAMDAAVRARRHYHPLYYPGTITFLKAEKYDGPWQAYATFWAGLAEELDIHIVPGDHEDMITTYAEGVGAQLSLCIERGLGPEHHGYSAVGSATGISNRERALA